MKLQTGTTYLIRGIVAILCGVILLSSPGAGLFNLALIFTAYFLLEGLVAFIAGAGKTEAGGTRWPMMAGALINLCAAVVVFLFVGLWGIFFPRITPVLLVLIFSSRIILIGLIETAAAILRRKAGAPYLRAALGAGSVLFGLVLVYLQDEGVFTFVRPIGAFCLVFGILFVFVSFKVGAAMRALASHQN